MIRILKALNKLAEEHIDKIVHFIVCYALVLTLALWLPIEASVGITVIIGVAKEFWDRYRNGVFSVADIVADILGIALAYLIYIGA